MNPSQTDEMNTEVMENAANAAARRREMRRRKILMDPEERMRKLTGYNKSLQEKNDTSPVNQHNINDRFNNDLSRVVPPHSNPMQNVQQDVFGQVDGIAQRIGQMINQNDQMFNPQNPNLLLSDSDSSYQSQSQMQGTTHQPYNLNPPSKSFIRRRYLLCLFMGILIRISLMYSVGRRFVQSIINPFVFLEIAIIGYMHATALEFGSNIQGGLWLSMMILSGVKQEVIHNYKTIMGIITAVIDDFSVYFFAFIMTHVVHSYFA